MVQDPLIGFYKVVSVNESESTKRFGVDLKGLQYQLFCYFPVGNDGSLSIHSYFQVTHTLSKRIDKPPKDLLPHEIEFNIDELKNQAIEYAPQKYTFHQSGIQNMKNGIGQRFPGDNDVISIPFKNIDKAIRLCYFCPTFYDRYPKIDLEKCKSYNIFELKGNVLKMPTINEIWIFTEEYNLLEELRKFYTGFAAFLDSTSLKEFKLNILTVLRKSPNPHFPSTQVFIREHY